MWAKLEGLSPGGGSKDRVALHVLSQAAAAGRLQADTVVIEASAGQMGLSLAAVCAARGHRLVLVMPSSVPDGWLQRLRALGAECVLTGPAGGMAEARAAARALAERTPGALLVEQFTNPHNPDAHRHTTAQELLRDFSDLELGGLVIPVGTGGTLAGVAPALRRRWPRLRIWAIEPAASPVLSGGAADQHNIPGIGADFMPPLLADTAYDQTFAVTDQHAWEAARALARAEGLMVCPASGAAFVGARRLAAEVGEGGHVVFLCPNLGRDLLAIAP